MNYRYLADAGIDGVKVDAQSGIGAFGAGNGGGPQFARSVVRAAEDSVRAAFSQSKVPAANSIFSRLGLSRPQVSTTKKFGLEGCMCHSSENFLNFYETSTVRASDDFYPKDRAAQTVHIASCAYNSVLLSEIALPDWDMFHSKHEFALVHAAARAISGGPIYVSDNIGNHDPTVLARLVLPNGDVLRTSLPARPTVDCLFSDVMRDRKTALKVFSVNKVGGGVVGVFNVQGAGWDRAKRKYYQHDASPPVVFTEVSARSCGSTFLRSGGKSATGVFVAWLVLAQELKLLESELVSIPVQVGVRACEVVTIAHVYRVQPITYFGYKLAAVEWAPLGLIDMLNPGGAVVQLLTSRKYNEAKLTIRGVGRFGIYCSRMPITVTVNGKRVPFEYSQDSLLVIEISGPVTNRQISLTW
jgi:raffinose synthase